jgi:hypothetical protein
MTWPPRWRRGGGRQAGRVYHPRRRHAVQHLGLLLQRIGRPDWLEIVPGVTSFAAIAARKNAAGHGAAVAGGGLLYRAGSGD